MTPNEIWTSVAWLACGFLSTMWLVRESVEEVTFGSIVETSILGLLGGPIILCALLVDKFLN